MAGSRPPIGTIVVTAVALLAAACSSNGGEQVDVVDTSTTLVAASTTDQPPVPAPLTTSTTGSVAGPVGGSAGCEAEPDDALVTGETTLETLVSDGSTRSYRRHVPSSHDGTEPLPLVLSLHGMVNDSEAQVALTEFDVLGEQEGFITLTPEGQGSAVSIWNINGTDERLDDLAFLGDLLDTTEATLCVDTTRVYVAGYSSGAHMASQLLCSMEARFAAALAVGGLNNISPCEQDQPVAIMAVHGTADTVLPLEGWFGEGLTDADFMTQAAVDEFQPVYVDIGLPPIRDAATDWAMRNGCGSAPQETTSGDITHLNYLGCAQPVELYIIEGGGHTWPGTAAAEGLEDTMGPAHDEFDTTREAWDFFSRHHLRD